MLIENLQKNSIIKNYMQTKKNKEPKVAIVHDWLTSFAGSEQVVSAFLEIFPDAPIFTSLYIPKNFPAIFRKRKIYTSYLQKSPIKKHQLLFPFMGRAFEKFDLSGFDIVLTSSHASSKGVITKPKTLHVCYCHTPTRYLWSHYHEYLNQMEFGFLNPIVKWRMPKIAHKLRIWDRLAADRVDLWIANSKNTASRIKKYYRANSKVIYPPVDTKLLKPSSSTEDFFLVCSRLIPYKKINLVVEAFNDLEFKLKIIGTGSMEKQLRKVAKKNVEFLGRVEEKKLKDYYSKTKALIFPTEEDFGIVPVEAMASGRPVIAYRKGGACETVIPNVTGLFFESQTKKSLISAIIKFQKLKLDSHIIRKHAEKFSKKIFKEKIKNFIYENYERYMNEGPDISKI